MSRRERERGGERGSSGWQVIEAEALRAFAAGPRFALPAYSEFMPAPYLAPKPYELSGPDAPAREGDAFDVSEYEQAEELEPGLARVAEHLCDELGKLATGKPHELSRVLLTDNPAWPAELAEAARAGKLAHAPLGVFFPLALSRTQDDKGNVPWTLFGVSHEGPSRPFWRSFGARDGEGFARVVAWAAGDAAPSLDGVRACSRRPAPPDDELPPFARALALTDEAATGVAALLEPRGRSRAFRPFAALPPVVRAAFLAGTVRLLPHPASLVFFEHMGYRRLAETLPRARQIPLLHLYPRVEGGYTLRIPQSGWLDEVDAATTPAHGHEDAHKHGHKIVRHVVRTHRWQRAQRDAGIAGDGAYTDEVSTALFSSDADDLGLYGKPMARNAQIWREDYRLVLDGPRAEALDLENAAGAVDRGGRFGYRFIYPPLRAGTREIFWHLPLVARHAPGAARAERLADGAPQGYVLAEAMGEAAVALAPRHARSAPVTARRRGCAINPASRAQHHGPQRAQAARTRPRRWARPARLAGARRAARRARAVDRGLARGPRRSGAREPPGRARGSRRRRRPRADVRGDGDARVRGARVWGSIASLAKGPLRNKENADVVAANHGRHGGPAALPSASRPRAAAISIAWATSCTSATARSSRRTA